MYNESSSEYMWAKYITMFEFDMAKAVRGNGKISVILGGC